MKSLWIIASMLFFVGWSKGQSTDVFLMPGLDVVRPGSGIRSNFNIGIGHTYSKLHVSFVGEEVTFSYTYENAGSHGFWHTRNGSHTESIGVMRNFQASKSAGFYTWTQSGLTSFTGEKYVQNRLYAGVSFGATYRISPHGSVWIQESYNKIATVPWYTSANMGYVFSF